MDFDSTKPSAYNGRLLTPLIAQLLSIKAPVQRNLALLTQDRRNNDSIDISRDVQLSIFN